MNSGTNITENKGVYRGLREAYEKFQEFYLIRCGQAEELKRRLEEARNREEEVLKESDLLQQVRVLLTAASEYAREQARHQIEQMVSQALGMVFGPEIEFKVEVLERRGQVEAEFYVVSKYGGQEVTSRPQDSHGGGVVDVISLALRVTLLETLRPPLNGPLLLDEPGKHISDEFVPNVAGLLKSLSESFGRQVVMITHNQHLSESADLAYVVDLKDGHSVVRRLQG